MIREFLKGAWYADYLPSGAMAATIPHIAMLTREGLIPFPAGETFGIGFPRITDIGGVRFAGQAHDTLNPACWEHDDHKWVPYAPPCHGVSPVIYDREGVLHRATPADGSQGYRYVTQENVIVTGDQTFGPFHGLFEYTDLGDGLWIGQAAYDGGGVQVLERGDAVSVEGGFRWTLRQLELGYCVFIRANRAGNVVTLAFFDGELNGVLLIRTTMAELRALPPVVAPLPIPPTPPVVPKPVPVPPKPTPPKPLPEPWPHPPVPEEPHMANPNDNPSYDEFINGPDSEALQVRNAYVKAHAHEPAIPDYYHNAWRRLRERWTARDIVHDILGEPLEDGGPGGADHGNPM